MIEINELLRISVERNASDIFITVGIPPTLKIDGNLVKLDHPLLSPEDTEKLIMKLFKLDEHYRDYLKYGDKDFSISLKGVGRFRVDVYKQRGSMAAAIRVLKFESNKVENLKIPDIVLDFYKKTKGLVIVTGPTGSGKSTTISAIIDLINKNRDCHIITIEDPIEHLHRHDKSIVDQREVGIDSKSYKMALRAALRQAPDVIFIGEMRDYETISIALTAAETGHLVFSTLHTVGAAKTIDRIVDVFPANQQQQVRVQLSTVLEGVISQQLIPSENIGRIPAFEIMLSTPAISNMIRSGKVPQIEAAIQTGRSEGMISMDVSIAELYNKGLISKENAELYCVNIEAFERYAEE
ncbi:MAG: type IV pilus twitching motility protein PilT [Bacillota bacterium]|nr:type IV pilus twitching motility protein PilT [Bacillota bacterium]